MGWCPAAYYLPTRTVLQRPAVQDGVSCNLLFTYQNCPAASCAAGRAVLQLACQNCPAASCGAGRNVLQPVIYLSELSCSVLRCRTGCPAAYYLAALRPSIFLFTLGLCRPRRDGIFVNPHSQGGVNGIGNQHPCCGFKRSFANFGVFFLRVWLVPTPPSWHIESLRPDPGPLYGVGRAGAKWARPARAMLVLGSTFPQKIFTRTLSWARIPDNW